MHNYANSSLLIKYFKNIIDLQINIDTVNPVQILSRSDEWQNVKNTKNAEKRPSLKNRGLVPTLQPEPDFSWTYGFR